MTIELWAIAGILLVGFLALSKTLDSLLHNFSQVSEAILKADRRGAFDAGPRLNTPPAVPAPPGTRLAYVSELTGEPEIHYAPVLAFVESAAGSWSELVPIGFARHSLGLRIHPEKYYCVVRLLLPGETLTDDEIRHAWHDYAIWKHERKKGAEQESNE